MREVGLVGVRTSGKSTFFKAATLKDVDIASYPFTTIDANQGTAHVRVECACQGLDVECDECNDGVRFVPFKIWDVAGLVPDAHKGKGKGNEFLDDLVQASALIHVLDASGRTNSKGEVTENFDPKESVKMLEREIDYWMLDLLNKDWRDVVRGEDFIKTFENRFSGLKINESQLEKALKKVKGKPKDWTEEDKFKFVKNLRKISKPILIAANKIDLPNAKKNVKNIENSVPCSAEVELALNEASEKGLINYLPGDPNFKIIETKNEEQKKAFEFMQNFLENYGSTGVQKTINKTVFDLLDMIVVYPVADENKYTDKKGNVLPDAHLVKKGTTAEEFAYKIHEDIGKSFIAAIDAKTNRNIASDKELENGQIVRIKSGK